MLYLLHILEGPAMGDTIFRFRLAKLVCFKVFIS